METAFFRFYSKTDEKDAVVSTSLISLLATTVSFVAIAFLFQNTLAGVLEVAPKYMKYVIVILALDALVMIPFAWLRANEKPIRYTVIKITNVAIYLGLNLFFLVFLPKMANGDPEGFFSSMYRPGFEISYILISNLAASGITLVIMLPLYLRSGYTFHRDIWNRMMKYAWPVLIAGIAYTINEVFDKIMLERLLPQEVAESELGMYAACYKLGMFMTLFATAFRLGIEPFFFSHSTTDNPQRAYAQITNYFVVLGSVILLGVVVFTDVLKVIFVDEDYWEAMPVVPIILLASFCLGIYHNLSVWYKVTDRTRFGAFISIIGAVITIVLNYAFIPKIGYYASALATLAAYGSMMYLSYFYGKKYYPIPYNLRKIIFYLILSISFSGLAFYVFNRNLVVGSLLLLVFLILVYRMENEKLRQIFLKR
jgi:O-antigen/teichoic acid export membrane protein